jgi:hypothetical protein
MPRDRKTRVGYIVGLCVTLLLTLDAFQVAFTEPLTAQADTIEGLKARIRSLEERVRVLESQLQEATEADPGTDERLNVATLQSQLTDVRDEIESLKLSLERQEEQMSRVKISGEERARFMTIDTHGAQAVGAYGEELKEESTFKHYLRLETRISISKNLTAGALVRITNVGETVLNEGPEYLSKDLGSAFLKYSRKEFNCIVGAYDIHLTPFTLMRWDQEDNPEGGGEAGGGCLPCGGVAGAIPRESLEELSPRLTYEGLRFNGMIRDFVDVTAFYAQPWQYPGTEKYRSHLFGARAKLLSYHRSSTSFRHLGLTVLTTSDEASSIIRSEIQKIKEKQPPALENNVFGADLHLPLSEAFLLRGEWTYTEVHLDSLYGGNSCYDGQGFFLGFKLQYPEYLKLRCSYLRLNNGFESAYRALSYIPNREGVRGAMTLEIPRWRSSISAFAKVLNVITKADPDEIQWDTKSDVEKKGILTETAYTASLGISIVPYKNLLIRPSFIYQGKRGDKDATVRKVDDNTYLFINELIFTVFKDNEFILRYQYIDFDDKVDSSLNYQAETIFTLFSLKF